MSEIYGYIEQDLRSALRNKNTEYSTLLKTLKSNIQDVVGDRGKITDKLVLGVIEKSIEAILAPMPYLDRVIHKDVISKLEDDASQLSRYIPELLSESETEQEVRGIIASMASPSINDLGRIMVLLKSKFGARLDMSVALRTARNDLNPMELKDILDILKNEYTEDDLRYLVGYCMGYDVDVAPVHELNYYDDVALMAYLSDWVLMHESNVGVMIRKDLSTLPLFINSSNGTHRVISRWRLKVGK